MPASVDLPADKLYWSPGDPALMHPAWLAFNQRQWGVTPEYVEYTLPDKLRPRLRGLLFLDKTGRVVQPKLNQELALLLEGESDKPAQRRADWHKLGAILAADLKRRGLAGACSLPRQFADVRPLVWAGLRTGVRYTTVVPLPYDMALADSDIRRRAAKAEREGFATTINGSMADLLLCLNETETRKGIGLGVGLEHLDLLARMGSPATVRTYITYAPGGKPASACIVLCTEGSTALLWVAGNVREFLPAGTAQLNFKTALEDCAALGHTEFDFNGANLPSVAASKEDWGGALAAQYTLEQVSLRSAARDVWRLLRGRGGA